MPRINWILRHLTFRSFPQRKYFFMDLHGKWFSDMNELHINQILRNTHGFVISTENAFNNTGNAYNTRETRESILRNCAIHRINDAIVL